MRYDVLITSRAERELHELAEWIATKAPVAAARWYRGFVQVILKLGDNPFRCAVARESPRFPFEIRELLYGRRRNYRAIYAIRETKVVIITIRHAARDDLTPEDLT
jgi:plasmid stabilization system protein ParE